MNTISIYLNASTSVYLFRKLERKTTVALSLITVLERKKWLQLRTCDCVECLSDFIRFAFNLINLFSWLQVLASNNSTGLHIFPMNFAFDFIRFNSVWCCEQHFLSAPIVSTLEIRIVCLHMSIFHSDLYLLAWVFIVHVKNSAHSESPLFRCTATRITIDKSCLGLKIAGKLKRERNRMDTCASCLYRIHYLTPCSFKIRFYSARIVSILFCFVLYCVFMITIESYFHDYTLHANVHSTQCVVSAS